MKIHISRQGIVIRTVEVKGDKGSIGSGADCAVRLDDPYLAAHVADIVNRGGEWRIVDAATSIDGVSHNGRRVEDEPLVSGERYSLGAFELMAEGVGPAASPVPLSAPSHGVPPPRPGGPPTMMDEPPIPKTMFETPIPGELAGSNAPPPAAPQFTPSAPSGFQPIGQPAAAVPPPAPPRPAAPPPKRRSKLPLILALFALMFVVLVLAGVIFMMGGKDEKVATPTATPTPAPTPAAAVVAPAEAGNQKASALEIDEALQSWEAAIQAGGNDELRVRYAKLAYDAAMVHAAANDTDKSKSYLERVIKFGPADSPEVEDARARTGS